MIMLMNIDMYISDIFCDELDMSGKERERAKMMPRFLALITEWLKVLCTEVDNIG